MPPLNHALNRMRRSRLIAECSQRNSIFLIRESDFRRDEGVTCFSCQSCCSVNCAIGTELM